MALAACRAASRGFRIKPMNPIARLVLAAVLVVVLPLPESEAQAPPGPRSDSILTADGLKRVGRVEPGGPSGFRFVPSDGSAAVPLGAGVEVTMDGPPPEAPSGPAPFSVQLGSSTRISGRFLGLDGSKIRLDGVLGRLPVEIDRKGAASVVQRPGEVQVFREGFETLDAARWSQGGSPEVVAEPRWSGASAPQAPGRRLVDHHPAGRSFGLRAVGDRVPGRGNASGLATGLPRPHFPQTGGGALDDPRGPGLGRAQPGRGNPGRAGVERPAPGPKARLAPPGDPVR